MLRTSFRRIQKSTKKTRRVCRTNHKIHHSKNYKMNTPTKFNYDRLRDLYYTICENKEKPNKPAAAVEQPTKKKTLKEFRADAAARLYTQKNTPHLS